MKVDDRFVDRFNAKFEKSDTCWLWTASTANGYGRFYIGQSSNGGTVLAGAHRVSYEIHIGQIPDGLTIDHLCHNRLCVNPDHLEAVTLGENIRRAALARFPACRCGLPYDSHDGQSRRCSSCERARAKRRWQQTLACRVAAA